MSDIRFNRWLHQSGTGGVSQDSSGNIGIGTTVPTMALDIRGDVNIGDTININNASGIISATTFTGTTGTFSGNVSAVDATFTGNVSIGGTLTYEDVANIDAVGIITAQSDIIVGGGLTVTGISTFNNDVKLLDSDKLKFGIGEDLQIYHDGSNSYVQDTGTGGLKLTGGDVYIRNTSDQDMIHASSGSFVKLYHNNSKKLETTSTGAVVTGILTATTFSGNLTGNVTGDLTGNLAGISSIAAISDSISDTAVDVFVYDTSKDSDGGAWRKRTQNTSWYNETLGTATRGTRKEFPAVAVIVAESLKVTIYDGDDPDLPMWMVFHSDGGNCMIRNSGVIASVTMLNAELCVGRTSGSKGLGQISFITEVGKTIRRSSSGYLYIYKGNIEQRNDSLEYVNQNDITQQIKGDLVYDVAMTVLPNAPVDSATGLPVPTIAVATDQGISVLKDNGSIFDMYPNDAGERPVLQIGFTESNKLVFRHNFNWVYYYEIPNSDLNAAYWNGLGGYIGRFTSVERDWDTNYGGIPVNTPSNITEFLEDRVLGHTNGLDIIDINNGGLLGYGMHAGITTNFNTGYQHGDIKGAFLSDTDTTNVTAGSNLIPASSADFSSSSGWNLGTGWTISGGKLNKTTTDNNTAYYSVSGLTVGQAYTFSIDVDTVPSSGNIYFYALGVYTIWPTLTTTGTHTLTVVANSTALAFGITGISGNGCVLDNVSLTIGDADRSVNNKGLQVFGTVTKSAVATGAELVGYGPFSSSNYLKQHNNSDLAPGTGAYSVTCWIKTALSGSNDQYIFDRGVGGSNSRNLMLVMQTSGRIQFYHTRADGTSSDLQTTDMPSVADNNWHQVVGLYDGSAYRVYIDGKASSVTNTTGRDVGNDGTPALTIGTRFNITQTFGGSMALFRYSKSAPSPEQIKKIYEDEKCLFHENAKATLYGSSDAVTGLAFDDTTNLLHVGTSAGRSEFQGLRRINNTTDAVTTAISASNGLVAEQ